MLVSRGRAGTGKLFGPCARNGLEAWGKASSSTLVFLLHLVCQARPGPECLLIPCLHFWGEPLASEFCPVLNTLLVGFWGGELQQAEGLQKSWDYLTTCLRGNLRGLSKDSSDPVSPLSAALQDPLLVLGGIRASSILFELCSRGR